MFETIVTLAFFSILSTCFIGASICSDGLEFVNPIWLHKRFKVNWFGAIFIAILFNILCTIFSCCYWFYKLCTVGRK